MTAPVLRVVPSETRPWTPWEHRVHNARGVAAVWLEERVASVLLGLIRRLDEGIDLTLALREDEPPQRPSLTLVR